MSKGMLTQLIFSVCPKSKLNILKTGKYFQVSRRSFVQTWTLKSKLQIVLHVFDWPPSTLQTAKNGNNAAGWQVGKFAPSGIYKFGKSVFYKWG